MNRWAVDSGPLYTMATHATAASTCARRSAIDFNYQYRWRVEHNYARALALPCVCVCRPARRDEALKDVVNVVVAQLQPTTNNDECIQVQRARRPRTIAPVQQQLITCFNCIPR